MKNLIQSHYAGRIGRLAYLTRLVACLLLIAMAFLLMLVAVQHKAIPDMCLAAIAALVAVPQFDSFMRHYLTLKTGTIPNLRAVYDAFKAHARAPGIEDARDHQTRAFLAWAAPRMRDWAAHGALTTRIVCEQKLVSRSEHGFPQGKNDDCHGRGRHASPRLLLAARCGVTSRAAAPAVPPPAA